MDTQNTRLKILLQRFHSKTASQEEIDELRSLINSDDVDQELKKIWNQAPEQDPFFSEEKSAQMLTGILQHERAVVMMPKKRKPALLMAAAAVLALVFAGTWIYFNTSDSAKPGTKNIVKTDHKQTIVPGSDKARLTLSDGTVIVLDSTSNGTLALQGNSKIIKLNDQVIYNKNNQQAGTAIETTYNTLSTPRGGQYMLTLEDGTKVWLNAVSSIKYPSTFGNGDRTVELTGEAYFEVAKNPAKPFKVSVQGMEIQVLGTHFNVMAYSDEAAVKTTLLEGSVKVSGTQPQAINSSLRGTKQNAQTLVPGQQAQQSKTGELKIMNDVDLEQVVAWKNGYFQFNRDGIEVIMKQIARWYDVEISYEGKIAAREFGGKISRNSDIREILKVLELNNVHFRIEGKKIIVMTK
ncbi:MAG TPA: FecR family protein [Chitinophagaceae bacterium]|nr:FecR family protein [Chitinophagaceae bacterium]